ncbi:MAG: FHA domain-containing protein, partial [Okeania sp. SIO2H7]|nr:FHA domain-containing protein [Okeania sp. SIO2H7]
FKDRTTCLIGRSSDCQLKLPNDELHRTISRYHCLLDINPPDIRVRDFGSKNGTYINGAKIGQRPLDRSPKEAAKMTFPEHDLKEGDEIKIGKTVFQISIQGVREGDKSDFTVFSDKPQRRENGKVEQKAIALNKNDLQDVIQNLIQQAKKGELNLVSLQDYTILKLLGKGKSSEVHLALDDRTGELVAIKMMLPQVIVSQRAREEFLREAENTKALNHPNIVKLKDDGYFNGTFFFTLEYCHGGSVLDLMKQRGGKLLFDEALPIILQALEGLEYAHNAEIPYLKKEDGSWGKGKGFVHGHIQPDNLFLANVSGSPVVKIADYGLAKAFDLAGFSGQTMSGDTAGIPVFIPRQQVISFNYSKPEMDVWAMAATVYNMLTGTSPRDFTNKDPFLVVLQNDAVPIREREPSIPKKVAEVIDLALRDTPDIYFKTAAAFKRALLQAI